MMEKRTFDCKGGSSDIKRKSVMNLWETLWNTKAEESLINRLSCTVAQCLCYIQTS